MDFPVDSRDIDRILRREGTKFSGRIGDVTQASPSLGTIFMSRTFVSGGTFNHWIKTLRITASVDCQFLLNIRLANGFVNESNLDLKGVYNDYINLRAGIEVVYQFDNMLLYNQVMQFIFQKYNNGASGAVNLVVTWQSYEIFMNRNMFAPLAIKFLGNSITAGANSSTTNLRPFGSWAQQLVHDKYGATQDVKGINKGVGGVTAAGMNQACITGWSSVDNANLIMIALGTNPDTSDDLFASSVNTILNRERALHPDAWQIVMAPIVKANSGEIQMQAYRQILQGIVASRPGQKVIYAPMEQLGVLPGVIPSDVHPNQDGHDDMADFLWNEVIQPNNITL